MNTSARHPLDSSLWLSQWTLAGGFFITGLLKTTVPAEVLARIGLATGEQAQQCGALELGLALAVVLPAVTRLAPRLSTAAAAAMAALALLGVADPHGAAGTGAQLFNLLLAAVAVFAAWGRAVVAPVSALAFEEGEEGEHGLSTELRPARSPATTSDDAAVPAPGRISQEAARRPVPESAPGWDLSGQTYALSAGAAHDVV